MLSAKRPASKLDVSELVCQQIVCGANNCSFTTCTFTLHFTRAIYKARDTTKDFQIFILLVYNT